MQTRQHARRFAIALVFAVVSAPASGAAQATAAPSKNAPAPARTPDVIFVPTPREVVDQMLAVARVGKNDVVYDLGSGDGRIVITAAARFGARGIGIDIDPQRIAESRKNADSAGVTDRVKFYERDLFKTDLSEATVVTLYLLPELNVKLRPKLFAELKPGTRIASHDFDMGDWQPDSVMKVPNSTRGESTVYYWVLPANVAGTWHVSAAGDASPGGGADRRYTVRFKQHYQHLTGTATAGGRSVPITDARLLGERITFTLTDTVGGQPVAMRFSGRVSGGAMTGALTTSGSDGDWEWSAARVKSGRAAEPHTEHARR